MRRHFFQLGQNTADVVVGIHERNHYRKFAASLDHMCGFNSMPSQKTGYGMKGSGRVNILFPEIPKDFHV
jgi:hypothetical protein